MNIYPKRQVWRRELTLWYIDLSDKGYPRITSSQMYSQDRAARESKVMDIKLTWYNVDKQILFQLPSCLCQTMYVLWLLCFMIHYVLVKVRTHWLLTIYLPYPMFEVPYLKYDKCVKIYSVFFLCSGGVFKCPEDKLPLDYAKVSFKNCQKL